MPNRIVKDTVWSSENLCRASIEAQGFFLRLLPLPDDHGCFDARTAILRARLFPLNYAQVTEKKIEQWLTELIAVDCIRVWTDSGVRYGIFPSWGKHQQVRSLHHRKTPAPPAEILTEKIVVENKDDSNCEQVPAVGALNPNPNPVPLKAPKGAEHVFSADFLEFWESYPKKTEKLEAFKAWQKLRPSLELRARILRAVIRARASPDWLKEGGRFIPNPAKWLRRGNWDDETRTLTEQRPKLAL